MITVLCGIIYNTSGEGFRVFRLVGARSRNGLQLQEVGDFEELNYLQQQNLI